MNPIINERIREELTKRIKNNAFPDKLLPTEENIAKEFEASRGTVRMAMAKLEEDGLIYRVKGKGTYVKEVSTNVTVPVKRIALVYSADTQLNMAYYSAMFRGAVEAGKKYGASLKYSPFQSQHKGLISFSEIEKSNFDAALLVTPLYKDIVEGILERGVSVVTIDFKYNIEKVSSIVFDRYESARISIEYLMKKGHKRIGILAGPVDAEFNETKTSKFVEQAYRELTLKYGIQYEKKLVKLGDWSRSTIPQEITELLDGGVKAFYCASEDMIHRVLNVCSGRNILVPRDIEVVGICPDWCEFPFTTVQAPIQKLGEMAVQMICTGDSSMVQKLSIRPELKIVENAF